MPGGSGACGKSRLEIVARVSGSMIRACGGAPAEGQTETIRPRVSKVSDPQSEGGFASELAARLAPSGPAML